LLSAKAVTQALHLKLCHVSVGVSIYLSMLNSLSTAVPDDGSVENLLYWQIFVQQC